MDLITSLTLKKSSSPFAQLAFQNKTGQNNPKPIAELTQLESLLQGAW